MPGDYTSFTFKPQKDVAELWMEQGRVLLASDWNELADAVDRRFRAETKDIIGPAVVPTSAAGFQILVAGSDLSIGQGRAYVDGLLAENHGVPPPAAQQYDASLGELIGTQPILYSQQLNFPNPPAFPPTGQALAFLDVWDREVTWLEDPDLIDPAVGVDTSTRIQTVWQVKLFNIGPDITCTTPGKSIQGWPDLIAPSAGRLTTAAAGVPSSTDPCIVPPNGGYRGTENRLYRVEIHTGGPLGTAQFKWSRDNASVGSPVTAINAAGDTLSVVRIGRDSVLRFQPGDWVEVTDDVQEFSELSGDMHQVTVVDDVQLTITVAPPLPAGKYDPTNPKRHTRVIRWDQKGIVRDPLGNVIVNVDTNGGLIPVPLATTVVLEDGVQVTFATDPVTGSFHVSDYWCFAARTVDASVEPLDHAPPRGILHHFARLAIVNFADGVPTGTPTDCRTFWPPRLVFAEANGGPAVGPRDTLNFIGAGITVADNPSAARIDVSIPRGTAGETSPTVLLFPLVTTQSGFDTGISVVNTTEDPFGTTPQSGNVTFNYFPNPLGTPQKHFMNAGDLFSFQLSSILQVGEAYSGYMIAVCEFPGAYGLAIISDNAQKFSSYLPIILPKRPIGS
jgi:hypothetical protein